MKKKRKGDTRSNDESKDKVSLEYNLDLERMDKKDLEDSGYDFVPRSDHWTSPNEQQLKVEEIENKTQE